MVRLKKDQGIAESPRPMAGGFHEVDARCLFASVDQALKEDPQPQVLFTLGFSNLNPAASSVST